MKFEVEITNTEHLAGITAARQAHNAALPDVMEEVEIEPAVPPSKENPEGVPAVKEMRAKNPKPGTIATDADYVQFVMSSAAESYAKQYSVA